MRIALTHTGSSPPEYIKYCLRQIRAFNPHVDIDIITHTGYAQDYVDGHQIREVSIENLATDTTLQKFREVSFFKVWGKPQTTYPSPENFVQGTSERVFLLNAYMKKYNFNDVWHFENDNLIYQNVEGVMNALKKQGMDQDIACCYMGPQYLVFNVAFIRDPQMLEDFCTWYATELQAGDPAIRAKYGMEMVHEMTMLKAYHDTLGRLKLFPSIPEREASLGGIYFDPASYGQFIAGTNNGHAPGFTDTVNHDIGKAIRAGNITDVHLVKGLGATITTPTNTYPLFNLHMHNKSRMGEFVTYE